MYARRLSELNTNCSESFDIMKKIFTTEKEKNYYWCFVVIGCLVAYKC